MSEKMWEVTVKHANTCVMGNKMFIYRGAHFALFLNPICQVLKAMVNGQFFPIRDLSNINRVCTIFFFSSLAIILFRLRYSFAKLYVVYKFADIYWEFGEGSLRKLEFLGNGRDCLIDTRYIILSFQFQWYLNLHRVWGS